MSSDLDILSQLPNLKWRGIVVPCQTNGVSFDQGHAIHKQHGKDGAHVESLGRNPAKFNFRIPFRVGILGFPDLYPGTFREFWAACLDNSIGTLSHPEFGDIDCKVASFNLSVDPGMRSGYDADVSWIETSEQGRLLDQNKSLAILESTAQSLDDIVFSEGELPKDFVDKYLKDKKLSTNLLGLMRQIQGMIYTVNSSIEGTRAKIDAGIAETNRLIDALSFAHSYATVEARRNALVLNDALHNIKEAFLSADGKRLVSVFAQSNIQVARAAASAGMTYEEFVKVNPRLARNQYVERGTEYVIRV